MAHEYPLKHRQRIELLAFGKITTCGLYFQNLSCYRVINLREAVTTEKGVEMPDGVINEQQMLARELGSVFLIPRVK